MSLADKINQARVVTVKVDHMTFTGRRPTYEEFGALFRGQVSDPEIIRRFTTGWDGVRESDLILGGSDAVLSFDKTLFDTAIADRPKLWKPLVDAYLNATIEHQKAVDAASKN
jgi:hypothetical protein